MSKFAPRPTNVRGPVETVGPMLTHEGGIGAERDPRSELFLLAVTNLVSEDTFYEAGDQRDARFAGLVHAVTASDPEWIRALIPFLRDTMQMRSASIMAAAEYVRAGGPNGRDVVRSAISRADEPGEMLAYWRSAYGRSLPMALKRGVADAVRKLYTERAAIKWDGTGRPWRFADVIESVHPKPTAAWQSHLFKYLLDKRHHGEDDEVLWEDLTMLHNDRALRRLPEDQRRQALGLLDAAGWSWERLSGWLPGGMDREAWEAVIPQMGYMALLRNLRNFDQAGVSDEVAAVVSAKLADPDEVAKSRQFPFRYYSAYKEIGSLRWAPALEKALDLALSNVPTLAGKTLILVDLSPSMGPGYHISGRSKRVRYELAALFGGAVGKRAEHATYVVYSSPSTDASEQLRQPLLRIVEHAEGWIRADRYGGTETFKALATHYAGHDRVVIVTDEQAHDAGHYPLPDVPIYTWNLAGYQPGHLPAQRNRYTVGGLTDSAFRLIPLLEAGRDGAWGTVFAGG